MSIAFQGAGLFDSTGDMVAFESQEQGSGGFGQMPPSGGAGLNSSDVISWTVGNEKFFFVPAGSDATYAHAVGAYHPGNRA